MHGTTIRGFWRPTGNEPEVNAFWENFFEDIMAWSFGITSPSPITHMPTLGAESRSLAAAAVESVNVMSPAGSFDDPAADDDDERG